MFGFKFRTEFLKNLRPIAKILMKINSFEDFEVGAYLE